MTVKRFFLACLFSACVPALYASAGPGTLGVGLPSLSEFIQRLGQPTERGKEGGKDSLYWKSERKTVHVYADAEVIYTLLISVSSQQGATTVQQAIDQVERLCPGRKWEETVDSPNAKQGARVFRTTDGRLECAVILTKEGESYGYFAFVGDLALKNSGN